MTILIETTCAIKWSRGMFENPFPRHVKVFWTVFSLVLLMLPIWQFNYKKINKVTRR